MTALRATVHACTRSLRRGRSLAEAGMTTAEYAVGLPARFR
jgi:hypothetical protein